MTITPEKLRRARARILAVNGPEAAYSTGLVKALRLAHATYEERAAAKERAAIDAVFQEHRAQLWAAYLDQAAALLARSTEEFED